MIKFKINGREVQGNKEDTIWKIAKSNGISIPHLCHSDEVGYKPDGNCRACVVQVKGERTLTASCIRKPVEGMEVTTNCDTSKESQKIIFELLEADQPDRDRHPDSDSKFWNWFDKVEAVSNTFQKLKIFLVISVILQCKSI